MELNITLKFVTDKRNTSYVVSSLHTVSSIVEIFNIGHSVSFFLLSGRTCMFLAGILLSIVIFLFLQEVAEPLMDLKKGLEGLHCNRTFRCILSAVLAFGNFLNGSSVRQRFSSVPYLWWASVWSAVTLKARLTELHR